MSGEYTRALPWTCPECGLLVVSTQTRRHRCRHSGQLVPVPEAGETVADDLARLKAQLTEARRVLKLVEWSGFSCIHDGKPVRLCSCCDASPPTITSGGHAPDCALAKALGET